MKHKDYVKYFTIVSYLLMFILGFFIVKPFIIAILNSAVLSYIFYPVYLFFLKRTKRPNLSTFITLTVIFLIVLIPLAIAINAMAKEVISGYDMARSAIINADYGSSCQQDTFMCGLYNSIDRMSDNERIKFTANQFLVRIKDGAISVTSNIFISLPSMLLQLFVTFFLAFYFIRDGNAWIRKIRVLLPIKQEYQVSLAKNMSDITHAVIYGNIVVAAIKGVLVAVGFLIFGVKAPLVWGLIAAFTALIPYVGATIVWLPAAILKVVHGLLASDGSGIGSGIGLFLFGVLIVASVDNLLMPKLVSGKSKVHPAIILLGILGGLGVFGMSGVILGPLALAMLYVFLKIIYEERERLDVI